MDVLPRGESKKQKRKLKEIEEGEPMPPGLEELVVTPSPESNESEEKEGPVGPAELISPRSNDSDRVHTPTSPVPEDDGITRVFRTEGQRKILESAERDWIDYYSDKEEYEEGVDPGWIDCPSARLSDEEYRKRLEKDKGRPLTWKELFDLDDVDGQTLEANLSVDLDPEYYVMSEDEARKKGYYPNWDELAKYIKQLKQNEGFDLDVYENLGVYASFNPQRLYGEQLKYYRGHIRMVLKAAIDFYNMAGGAILIKQGEVQKASNIFYSMIGPNKNPGLEFFINFTAVDCIDGKERHYEARAAYDILNHIASADLVRLKKEPTQG